MTKFWALCIAATFVLLELAPASADPCTGSDTCPTQQYAVAGGPTEVTVSWVQPDTLPAYFIVSRSQSGSGFAVIGQQTTGNPNDPETYPDYTAQPNTSYVYQICGWYSASQQACATTNTVITPPIASNTATPPPTITQASATSTSITISWNGNATYESYNVSQVLLDELGIEQPTQAPAPGGASGSWTFGNATSPLQPSTGYQVAVQGCQPGETSSNCSQWTTKNIWTQSPAAPPPLEPPTPRTQVQGGDIIVEWGNPTGVWTASVTRAPAWLAGSPSALSTLWVCANGSQTPCLVGFNFLDELALAGQVYTYTVCLYYKPGNYESDDACGSTTGEWPMPSSGNGTGMSTPILHVPSHLVAVDSASALAQLGKQSSLFYLPSHLVAVDSANALAQLGKQTSLGSCKPGLVWREAYAGDQVCVTTQTRAQAAADNQAAAQRQTANGQCIQGYVWRQARPQDHVCVTPQTRAQIAKDNAAAGASQTLK